MMKWHLVRPVRITCAQTDRWPKLFILQVNKTGRLSV